MSILDEIVAEVGNLSDDEIAVAAQAIQARKEKERAKMTPERKEQMKQREQRKRALNREILRLAKEKGLLAQANAAVDAAEQA